MFGWLRKFVGANNPLAQQERPPPRPTLIQAPPPEAQVTREFFNSVSGVTYPNPDGTHRQSIIQHEVRVGMALVVGFENDNPVDQNAVALFTPNGHQIGYLNQRTAMDVRDHIARGKWLQITVSATMGGTPDRPTYGVNILLKVLEIPVELPMRRADFRKAITDAKREGKYEQVEEWLLQDIAEHEKPFLTTDTAVSAWPYEQLANLYKQQHRWADEVAILTRHFALPKARRVALTERLQQRLDVAVTRLKDGTPVDTRA